MIGRIRERLGQAGYALDTPPTEVDAFDREVPWYRSSAGSSRTRYLNHARIMIVFLYGKRSFSVTTPQLRGAQLGWIPDV